MRRDTECARVFDGVLTSATRLRAWFGTKSSDPSGLPWRSRRQSDSGFTISFINKTNSEKGKRKNIQIQNDGWEEMKETANV